MPLSANKSPFLSYPLGLASQVAQSHPFLWKFSWETIHHLPFLLPHDRSYRAFRHFIKGEDGLFLDIGANDGISILSFRSINKTYRIFSLEPNQLLEPALAKRKALDNKVEYRMVGAGAAAATVRFFTPVYKNIILHTLTSTDEEQVRRAIKLTFGDRVAAQTTIKSFEADIVTVDSLHLNPAIMKIDTEGYDYQVLLGARETIRKNRPYIMIEMAWQDQNSIQHFISECDYELYMYNIRSDVFELFGNARNLTLSISGSGGMNCFLIPKEQIPSIPTANPSNASS